MAAGVARTHDVATISKVQHTQDWTLGQTGNWLEFKVDSDGDTNLDLDQDRVHNKANEIHHATYGSAITESTGPSWIDPKHDMAGNMTLMPKPGDEADANDALLCVYDAWNRTVETWDDSDGDVKYQWIWSQRYPERGTGYARMARFSGRESSATAAGLAS